MKELLEMLLTVVRERRINAGQQKELSKRDVTDLGDQGHDTRAAASRVDYWSSKEKECQRILDEMEAIICEVHGDDWRETLS